MKLSKRKFDQLLRDNQLMVSLVGMSNIGKTYWSEKFQDVGFKHINCDNLIEKKLSPILKKHGYSGIKDISRWMGQPYDKQFTVNQEKYMFLEMRVMEDIFARVKNNKIKNTVIDTTGGVIYTNKNIGDRLKQFSMVIYIKASENMKEEMFRRYLKEPKPVVFGDLYSSKNNETDMQALSRCYRELLSLRNTLYSECADVIIPREAIKENANIHHLISLIKQSL